MDYGYEHCPCALLSVILGVVGVAASSSKKKPVGSSVAGIVLSGLALLLAICVFAGMMNMNSHSMR